MMKLYPRPLLHPHVSVEGEIRPTQIRTSGEIYLAAQNVVKKPPFAHDICNSEELLVRSNREAHLKVNCIKIRSKYLEEIEIENDQVIVFPEGLPAFEDERQFVIIPFAADSPFFYLQSLKNARLCFILADIFTFFPDYEVEIDNHELQRLKIEEGGQGSLNVFALLTIPKVFAETTANLLAPLVINFEKQVGIQYIPNVSMYHTKHPLFEDALLSPIRGVK